MNRDAADEKQFGGPGQGQGGYGSQGYGDRPGGGYGTYGGQGGYGRPGQGQPPDQNNNNNNVNNNANSNQNQNANAYQDANPNNNVGSLVGRPPVQRDVGEVGKRQEEEDGRSCPDNGSNRDDDSDQGKGDLIPPDGGDGTPGKRSEENTAKKGSSTRAEAKTCGIIVAMAVVIALV